MRAPELKRIETSVNSGATLAFYTDENLFDDLGVRIAFTERGGGVSTEGYSSLNLGLNVEDDAGNVQENRRRVFAALDLADSANSASSVLINPIQVHGTESRIYAEDFLPRPKHEPKNLAVDSIICGFDNLPVMLCFADCVPVILVHESGVFAVIHAGWRGALHAIAEKTLRRLLAVVSGLDKAEKINAYIGPHISAASFEVEPRLAEDFAQVYGKRVKPNETHVDLSAVITRQLTGLGMRKEAILDLGIDTALDTEHFFSHRADGSKTGRFAAIAVRF